MTMPRIPMPSPNNTNFANKFLDEAVMAYDAQPLQFKRGFRKAARDQDPDDMTTTSVDPDDPDDSEAIQQLLELLGGENDIDQASFDQCRGIAKDLLTRRNRMQSGSLPFAMDAATAVRLVNRFGPNMYRLRKPPYG
jgi:hypothetical protein